MIGQTISRYKILERLGGGGMGEVWKAEDTTLGRPVALKFLAAHLLNDDEAKQRFLREAKAAAAISHPNICHVYEVGEEGGKTFLAMAYLEGEPLEARIAKGPLPLNDALDIGRQIAEGLEAAHENGIVHRDIKPANVIVDAKGRATILDFGLARLTEASKLTRADQTVGTAAYMSPEQIQGADVDQRTDIWALGCVLYEMVAGVRPFKGQYDQALAYEVIHEEPEPLTAVRAGLPMELELLVGKCLAKEAKDRYQSASELVVDLRTLVDKLRSGRSTVVKTVLAARHDLPPADVVPKRRFQVAAALAAILAIAWAASTYSDSNQAPVERPVRRWSFSPPGLDSDSAPAVSPDGRHIAYVANGGNGRSLWVRDLDQLEPRELAGTEGAFLPFWSHDSGFVGFKANGELSKIPVQGGPVTVLCDARGLYFGGSWSPDGESIVFSAGGGPFLISEVSARGGDPKLVSEQDSVLFPQFLPAEAGVRSLLTVVGDRRMTGDVVVDNLETGESITLAQGERAVYSPSGHVLCELQDELWALPFSLRGLRATGDAFPIGRNGSSVSVSDDGTLVTLRGSGHDLRRLVWRDRAGEKVGEIGRPQEMDAPVLSPDGKSVLVVSAEGDNVDIWVHEVDRAVNRRLTFDAASEVRPIWSSSGREIAFQSSRNGSSDIFSRAADGTGDAELLIGTEADERPYGWSRDGNYLIYTSEPNDGVEQIWYLKRKEDGQGFEPHRFSQTNFDEWSPSLSPDGGLLAYCSRQSGQGQVYVRPFPFGAGELQISTDGGSHPRWSQDGRELYYVHYDRGLMLTAVELRRTPALQAGAPMLLFRDSNLAAGPRTMAYDVSADGRFLMLESVKREGDPLTIDVVENWYEEFRDRED